MEYGGYIGSDENEEVNHETGTLVEEEKGTIVDERRER